MAFFWLGHPNECALYWEHPLDSDDRRCQEVFLVRVMRRGGSVIVVCLDHAHRLKQAGLAEIIMEG